MKLLLNNLNETLTPKDHEFLSAFASIVRKNGTLYLYYTCDGEPQRHLIGVATSTDNGKTWTRHNGNPIISKGARGDWSDREVWCPNVWFENDTFYMLFTRRDNSLNLAVGLAISNDGIHFAEYGHNPVLTGTKETWNEGNVEAWGIIKQADGYHLYYSTLKKEPRKIGQAFSTDLVHWSKSVKPHP